MPKPKTTQHGPTMSTAHTERTMTTYLVFEGELEDIADLDGQTTLFSSATSGFASLAIGLWIDIFVEGSPSDAAQRYGNVVEIGLLVIAAIFGCLAWRAYGKRQTKITRIKRESVPN